MESTVIVFSLSSRINLGSYVCSASCFSSIPTVYVFLAYPYEKHQFEIEEEGDQVCLRRASYSMYEIPRFGQMTDFESSILAVVVCVFWWKGWPKQPHILSYSFPCPRVAVSCVGTAVYMGT